METEQSDQETMGAVDQNRLTISQSEAVDAWRDALDIEPVYEGDDAYTVRQMAELLKVSENWLRIQVRKSPMFEKVKVMQTFEDGRRFAVTAYRLKDDDEGTGGQT